MAADTITNKNKLYVSQLSNIKRQPKVTLLLLLFIYLDSVIKQLNYYKLCKQNGK